MKILYVTENYYPHLGGITEHVHHLAIEMQKRGHEVVILTGGANRKGKDNTPNDVPTIRVGKSILFPVNKSFTRFTFMKHPYKDTKQIMDKYNFDVVHLHGPITPFFPMAALKMAPRLRVVTYHAAHGKNHLYYLISRLIDDYLRMPHGIIAVSRVAERSAKFYIHRDDFTIIPNGIDTKRFSPSVEPLPHLNDNKKNILFVGRFEPRKGLKYLLKAFPIIKKKIPNARLVIVGGGFYKGFYKKYIPTGYGEDIHLAGFVSGEELPRYYASCDVFCSPATGNESFGIILLEGMASKKCVVASDISGYRQVIDHGENGILVPPEDPAKLAEAIIDVLSNDNFRSEIARKARKKAENYSWEKIANEVESYYYRLMSNNGFI